MKFPIFALALIPVLAACTPKEQICERDIMTTKEGLVIYGEPCVQAPLYAPVATPVFYDNDTGGSDNDTGGSNIGNPGNGKHVGNSPFDGITGNSGKNNQNKGAPSAGPMSGQEDDTSTNQPAGGGADGTGSNANGNN